MWMAWVWETAYIQWIIYSWPTQYTQSSMYDLWNPTYNLQKCDSLQFNSNLAKKDHCNKSTSTFISYHKNTRFRQIGQQGVWLSTWKIFLGHDLR